MLLARLLEVLRVDSRAYFLYEHDVAFGNIENEILVLIWEEVLDNVVSGNIV